MSVQLTCKDLLGEMSDFVDGAVCEELQKHLAECPNCRVVVNTLRKTVELYHQPAGERISEGVKERLYFRLSLATLNAPQPESTEAGDLCPNCAQAALDFDEMLNLTCPTCGWTQAGCST